VIRFGWYWTYAAVLTLAVGFAAPAVLPPSEGPSVPSIFPSPGTGLPGHLPNDHIQHVIVVMMENHDYDSYFGTYCLVLGTYCSDTGNGIPAGTCVPYIPSAPNLGCVKPFNLTAAQFLVPDMDHSAEAGLIDRNAGVMNGFYPGEKTNISFGHYNQTTIPIYWDMAEEYASSDNFWAANLSYSLPNHWYLISATTPAIAYSSYVGYAGSNSPYLSESNSTSTIEDLLLHSTTSWKYYDTALLPYSQAINENGWGTAYDYWNPMAARAESYNSSFDDHFVPRSDFISDIQNNTLPNVSWVIPNVSASDHPGSNNSLGEAWVSQLVNAVESSNYWNSTAIFVSWDDFGGWYDHVAPPTILGDLLSFRAPILVISPYAKENYISHTQLSFMSLLHFIEWQFGLGCLRALDCLAPLPLDFFDFNQVPRDPILFQTSWTTAKYPMTLQSGSPLNFGCSSCRAISWSDWQTGNENTPNPLILDYS
jgi:phospholipase C